MPFQTSADTPSRAATTRQSIPDQPAPTCHVSPPPSDEHLHPVPSCATFRPDIARSATTPPARRSKPQRPIPARQTDPRLPTFRTTPYDRPERSQPTHHHGRTRPCPTFRVLPYRMTHRATTGRLPVPPLAIPPYPPDVPTPCLPPRLSDSPRTSRHPRPPLQPPRLANPYAARHAPPAPTRHPTSPAASTPSTDPSYVRLTSRVSPILADYPSPACPRLPTTPSRPLDHSSRSTPNPDRLSIPRPATILHHDMPSQAGASHTTCLVPPALADPICRLPDTASRRITHVADRQTHPANRNPHPDPTAHSAVAAARPPD